MSEKWEPVATEHPCCKCGSVGGIESYTWESSCGGYEDEHYRCTHCGKDWWIEGPDA